MEFLSHPIHEPIARRRAARPSRADGPLSQTTGQSTWPVVWSVVFSSLLWVRPATVWPVVVHAVHDGPVWECVKHMATATLIERGREWLVVCTPPTGRTTDQTHSAGKNRNFRLFPMKSIRLIEIESKSNQNSINRTTLKWIKIDP